MLKRNNNVEMIELDIHYGTGEGYNKNSLKAFKCEMEMKRAVKENSRALKYYMLNKHNLSFNYDIKMTEPGDPNPITEKFSMIELINDKLTSINASVCLSTYEVFKREGIMKAVSALHKFSSLTIM